ncbi:MAG TPA: type VI secretion system baseplate subunit TssK [Pyrinomonadaceae bacterium]|nr:type VI secretion system baseplate subunit TssK [Pyrinomonadaceae bacterium]
MNAYEIPDAIQWHEGLLLTPQHFQQLSSRHEALVQYGTSLVSPFCWGVRRFKHQQISLTPGKFRVLQLEAVMPDGLVVVHGLPNLERDGALEIDLSEKGEEIGERGVLIYLAVAARQIGNPNGGTSRYQAFSGDPVIDEVSAARAETIQRLKPLLTLHAGQLPPSDCVGFPIARVIYKNSSFVLDDKFIPPLLAVPATAKDGDMSSAAAQRLGEMCSQMALRVRKRAMYLADEARNPGAGSRFSNEAAARSVMLSLAGGLPAFEAVLQTGCAHPFPLYVALCGLAGHIATLGTDMVPPASDPYKHNDLYASFQPVLDFIDRAMDYGVPVAYKSFLFNYNEGAYELRFNSDWMKKKLAIGIKGERGMTETEVVRWGENCLIGSQNRIELMKTNRIRGASRQHAERVGDVVTPKGVELFSLIVDESYVEPETLLQIVNFETRRPYEIVLYVMDN